METQKVKMKCRQNIYKNGLSIMYDFAHIELTEGKWYEVTMSQSHFSQFIKSHYIKDDNGIIFQISPSDLEKYCYSLIEVRKIKIKKVLKQFKS